MNILNPNNRKSDIWARKPSPSPLCFHSINRISIMRRCDQKTHGHLFLQIPVKGMQSLWGGTGHFIPSPVPCCKSSITFWVLQGSLPPPSHNSQGRSSKRECSLGKKKQKNSAAQITFSQAHSKNEGFILEKASQEEKSYSHIKQEYHSERSEPPPDPQIQISGIVFH